MANQPVEEGDVGGRNRQIYSASQAHQNRQGFSRAESGKEEEPLI